MIKTEKSSLTRTASRRRAAVVPLLAAALLAGPLVAAAPTTTASAAAYCANVPWMDTAKSPEQRAAALLDASTQHQKYRWLVEQPANNPEQTNFEGVEYPAQVECTPKVAYTDGPDGVRFTPGVTAFPAPIALASAFDEELAEVKGAAQGAEAFDTGKNGVLAPGIASGRTPLSGRTAEYFGEDALLTGLLAASVVNGLEEGNLDKPVMSNLKHYVANEQELDRDMSSSNLDERTLREVYELPFDIALERSDPESIMCSYNQINGVYACENELLNTNVKGDLGFDGYILSDYGAVHSTAQSLVNGLDQELNRPVYFTPELLDAALAAGEITQTHIDGAASRVITSYIRAGLFDTPLPATPAADASTADHKALARQIAEQGTVLLKNDGVLPLAPEQGTTIALFGPTASSTPTDGVSAASVCSMYFMYTNSGTQVCEDLVAPDTAIRERAAEDGVEVIFNPGTDPASVAADAAAADVAIVFGYQVSGEFSDLPDLRLQGGGDALIEAVAEQNDSTVVVLNTGSAVEMPWVDKVEGIFEAWYSGEQGGPALARLLFGDVAPSGRLPMTFPKSLADVPTQTPEQYPGVFSDGSATRPEGSQEIRQVNYTEGLRIGYRWYESEGIEPLFEFGHGLTYSSFDYSRVLVAPNRTDGTRDITVRFLLANTGKRTATEVAQVYVEFPDAAGQPSKRLVGWERVTLKPGERRNVGITLSAADLKDLHLLQYWDEKADSWKTAKGTYTAHVGSSVDTAGSATFRVG